MSVPREPARSINITHREVEVRDRRKPPEVEAIVFPLYKPKNPPAPAVTPSGRGGSPAPKSPPAPNPSAGRSGRPFPPAPKVKTVPADAVVLSRSDWRKVEHVINYVARERGLK
jgi:hypothetical protein